jgi:uncharacterized protein involved in exopolysaccharide biosynthesis
MAVGSASLLDDEAQEAGPARPGLPLDPGRVWLSIKTGWKLLPLALAAGAVIGVLASTLFIGSSYKSEAVLIWEPTAGGEGSSTRDLSTQAGILKARVVLEAVRKKLKLGAPVEVITNQIEIWFDPQSNLVTIETSSPAAKGAFDLADALIEAFLNHQRTLGRTREREQVQALKADLKAAAASRDEAQAAYDAFRAAHGIGDFEFDSQHSLEALEALRTEASQAQAQVGTLEARAQQLESLSRSQPRMRTASASRSDPAVEHVAALKGELAAAKARLAPDHPRLGLLAAQLAAAQRQAASGDSVVTSVTSVPDPVFEQTQTTLAATRTELAAVTQRREALQAEIAKAEQRANVFTASSGEARKVLSEVTSTAQRAQELTAQLSRAQEAEVSAPPVAFRVLTPPVLPTFPQASKRKLVAIAVTLLALIGCGLYLVLRPARDGRIYTAREAAFWARMPVVGTSAWPRRPQLFRSLVDELNDRAMLAAGNTLVVASNPEDKALAGALAALLGPRPRPIAFSESENAEFSSSQATALVVRQPGESAFFAWPGESEGPTLRRAARMSDRVLIVIRAGSESALRATTVRTRLGRETNLAIVLVDVRDELLTLPDRVGNVEGFWQQSAFPGT